MVDVQKYSDIYKELVKLTPDDTLKLVIESKSEEEELVISEYILSILSYLFCTKKACI